MVKRGRPMVLKPGDVIMVQETASNIAYGVVHTTGRNTEGYPRIRMITGRVGTSKSRYHFADFPTKDRIIKRIAHRRQFASISEAVDYMLVIKAFNRV